MDCFTHFRVIDSKVPTSFCFYRLQKEFMFFPLSRRKVMDEYRCRCTSTLVTGKCEKGTKRFHQAKTRLPKSSNGSERNPKFQFSPHKHYKKYKTSKDFQP